jgi:hypothetical protein
MALAWLLGASASALAQEAAPPQAAPPQAEAPEDPPSAEPQAPRPDRGFKPSEEVSPDMEVDFPADI